MASVHQTGMLEGMLPSWCFMVLGAIAVPAEAAEPEATADPDSADDASVPLQRPASATSPSEPAATTTSTPSAEPAVVTTSAAQPTPAVATAPAAQPTPTPTIAASSEPSAAEPETAPDETTPAETTDPESDAPPPRTYPRLVIAGGPLVGPHAFGNEECNAELAECQTKGSFFGVGGNVEVRGRLWRPIYLHVRGLAVRNVSPNDPVYAGALGAGAGLGAYARRVFGRAEYQYVHAVGDNHFEPPFFDGAVATDEWGHHSGLISVGFRQPLPHHLSIELWGGLMLGPRSTRTVAQEPPDERRLTTFQIGLNLAWDAWR